MEEGKARMWYDKSVDIFHMLFDEGPSYGVDEKSKVIGMETWNAGETCPHKAGGKSHNRIWYAYRYPKP